MDVGELSKKRYRDGWTLGAVSHETWNRVALKDLSWFVFIFLSKFKECFGFVIRLLFICYFSMMMNGVPFDSFLKNVW